MAGLFLDVYIVYFFRTLWRVANLLRSRRWPAVTATILGSHFPKAAYNRVSIDYEYAANGHKYVASFEKPFVFDSSARAYTDQFARGMEFKIRIKPADPSVSVADSTAENWWNN